MGPAPYHPTAHELLADVAARLTSAILFNGGRHPRVIIIGARGRCGTSAIDFCQAAGVLATTIPRWDLSETAAGGPFAETVAGDIFINCAYLGAILAPPFVTLESLARPGRALRHVCDVSCDPNNAHSPVPI